MAKMELLLCLALFKSMFMTGSAADSYMTNEKRLYDDLMAQNNPNIRPVENSTETVKVHFGVALIDIVDVNEKANAITTQVWIRQLWQDYQLKWDPEEYGGVTTIRIPAAKIWKPDIVLFNTAEEGVTHYQEPLAVIYSSGDVLWIPPAVIKSRCHFDLTDFPYDTQYCVLKFGSWTYDGHAIDPEFYERKEEMDLSDYIVHNEWDVVNSIAVKRSIYYPCCPEPYPFLAFNLTIARKNSVFSVLSVTPYVFLAILCPIVFLFPYSETQRFSLGGSILICLVLMLANFETVIPASTGRVPMIARYYISVLVLLALSLIFSAVILNLADRKSSSSRPPRILKVILVDCLGRILCVPKENYDALVESETPVQNGESPQPRKRGNVEWRIMAQALDRLFFVIYALLTLILALAFFARKNR